VVRTATAWTWRGLRVDGFGDAALVHDPGWASPTRAYPGVGVGAESGGPFRTLLSVEWAYGFRAPRVDGGRGTQTARITVDDPTQRALVLGLRLGRPSRKAHDGGKQPDHGRIPMVQ
jgi:hypothetical protein